MSNWILCEDRVPDNEHDVLATYIDPHDDLIPRVLVMYYQENHWYYEFEKVPEAVKVVAWQPLPSPYNPEEKEAKQ